MRHVAILLVAVSSFFCTLARPQTAEELVQQNTQAKGGIDKIKAIHSLRVTGKYEAGGGFTATYGEVNLRPNLVRETLSLQGMTSMRAYDGTTGWQIQPFQGHKDPELVGEDDLRNLLLDADLDGPLIDYKEKGNTIEYIGHDQVDGDDALRLKVTLKNGDIIYYLLDPDTHLEIREEIQQFIRGAVRERIVDLGSYKPVAGVMYPYSTAVGSRNTPGTQVYTAQKIEANVAVDPAEFALPASLKASLKPVAEKK